MNELKNLLERAQPLDQNSSIVKFADAAIKTSKELVGTKIAHGLSFGELLAASFDLGISAAYAKLIGNNGWVFCRHNQKNKIEPFLFYPFVNACPRCLMKGKFVFTPCKKPESGKIGKITSVLLASFFNRIAQESSEGKCSLFLLGGSEDVDAVLREENKLCFLEIKSAPLVSFPFLVESDDLMESGGEGTRKTKDHMEVVNSLLMREDINIYLPLSGESISLGPKKEDESWPYDRLQKLVENKKMFSVYLAAWKDVYDRYRGEKQHEGSFWLSNGCGQPSPRPKDWPARHVGTGYESISDFKSSVGMDRTDDIKKGIYQVLKLGSHYKEYSNEKKYLVKTALISNIHAVRHYDHYLKEFSDIIWSVDAKDRPFKIKKKKDEWSIPADRIYNLYDGLIALTRSHIRDPWLAKRLTI